ncbi:MAG: SPFH domain-containing protein [Intestinibacter sp.]|uniref:SPFH domain-containing protein n=1 Tax=Intestinibacter sp. TaxID=1965304 RepID=UPI003F14D69D
MLNFKSIKFLPSEYVFKYKKGKIVKEGKGLSFIYYVPNTSVVVIPTSSADVPFIFQEITNDYQTVSVQGQITYKIADYKRVSEILDYTYDMKKKKYVTEDYKKIPQRLVNITKVLTKKSIENMPLKEAIKSSESLANLIRETLINSKEVLNLGIEIIGFSILAISPNKETARALEATAREEILKKADEAIYERRNSSIEQERIVKENELNTEIAIEEKRKQIQESQLESKRLKMEKENKMKDEELGYQTKLEEKRKEFIKLSVENAREESDSKAYQFAAMMKVFNEMDPNVIQALATINMEPEKLIAGAFQQLANKADKIGELNISPDLLQSLIKGRNI